MYLFYIRHAEPVYDPDGLTETGVKQAEALKERFLQYGLDKIYASSSERAIQTARPTAQALKLDIEILDWANEKYAGEEFGALNKPQWCFADEETKAIFGLKEILSLGNNWVDSDYFRNTGMRKGYYRVKSETINFIESLGYKYDSEKETYKAEKPKYERVALFAHGGFGYIFLSCLLNIPYPMFCTRFDTVGLSNVCVVEIKDEGEGIMPVLLQYSNDSHLYKNDLPREYGKQTF